MPERFHVTDDAAPLARHAAQAFCDSGADMLAAALAYASAGLPVFPCGVDKKPLIASGTSSPAFSGT